MSSFLYKENVIGNKGISNTLLRTWTNVFFFCAQTFDEDLNKNDFLWSWSHKQLQQIRNFKEEIIPMFHRAANPDASNIQSRTSTK